MPLTATTLFKYDCTSRSVCNPYNVYLKAGLYKFECWGASGGSISYGGVYKGGNGAYVSGIIKLIQDQSIYLYIGVQGSSEYEGFNGGGTSSRSANGGGGATDIRLIDGTWDNIFSLASRIIVAGAGGGANDYGAGGNAGTIKGFDGVSDSDNTCGTIIRASGGSQTSGGTGLVPGSFGKGGSKSSSQGDRDGGGGGGGYYGGGKGSDCHSSGAGGSSYVSGHIDCIAINEPNSDGTITRSGSSVHYSNLYFHNPIMRDGASSFLSPNGVSETGHSGDGAIKITILGILDTCRKSLVSFKSYFLYISLFIS